MSWHVALRGQVGTFNLDVELEGNDAPVALIGPNGSGKTTLLRMMAGAYRPTSGRITIDGATVFDSQKGILLAPESRRVGYVPQGFGLFPHLPVVDNVAFGLSFGPQKSRQDRRAAARSLLAELGCAALADRSPSGLSGGEQQRVALARALIVEPALLLLDEPLSTLDPGARRRVRTFLAERLGSRQGPAVVATHDLRDAQALGAEFVVLEAGRVVQRGSGEALRAAPANDFVAEFFDASTDSALGAQ